MMPKLDETPFPRFLNRHLDKPLNAAAWATLAAMIGLFAYFSR